MRDARAWFLLGALVVWACVFGRTKAEGGAVAISYPVIVAKVALTNQTAPIPLKTILTPQQDSLYRVSYYVDCSGLNLDWIFLLHWTDVNGNEESPSNPCNSPNNPSFGHLTVRAKAGSPLSYETKGVAGQYDLFFTAECLE